MTNQRGPVVASLVLMLLPAATPGAAPIPGGVLDPTGQTAYFAGNAGIEALSLGRGELLWRTSEARVPLLVAGDRLYGLALSDSNVMRVLGFDLANRGKRVYQSAVVELPRWVTTAEVPGRLFRWTCRQEKRVLLLSWQAAAWVETGPRKQAAGEVRIDLRDSTVKMGEIGLPAAPLAEPMPPIIAGLAVRWQRSIGGHLHALVLEETTTGKNARKQRLVLRTWNSRTDKEESRRELAYGSRLMALVGSDGFHLWLRDSAPSPDEAAGGESSGAAYQWAVYSALDGHLVARVPFLPGTQQATLIGDRAYCLTSAPLRDAGGEFTRRIFTLSAVDVTTGKTRWQRTLSSKALTP
jgi:hypothetical protein